MQYELWSDIMIIFFIFVKPSGFTFLTNKLYYFLPFTIAFLKLPNHYGFTHYECIINPNQR